MKEADRPPFLRAKILQLLRENPMDVFDLQDIQSAFGLDTMTTEIHSAIHALIARNEVYVTRDGRFISHKGFDVQLKEKAKSI